MNPLFVSRALKSISYSELPEGMRMEFEGRTYSSFVLPDWAKKRKRTYEEQVEAQRERRKLLPKKSRELKNIKAKHHQLSSGGRHRAEPHTEQEKDRGGSEPYTNGKATLPAG